MTDLDDAYANAAHIPGGNDFPARWQAAADAFCAAHPPQPLAYGAGARETVLVWHPAGRARGLAVIVHGGYWLRFAPSGFAHLAQGALQAGWAVALPGYTLAPQARISAMTRQIGAALARLAAEVPGPIHIAGHSAGGHLAARMACADAPLPADVAARIARVVPISPLSDLAPLMRTAMNRDLRLDPAEARAESPRHLPLRPGVTVHLWVGGAERPAFLDQARWLSEVWACPLTIDAGRHHFDVIEGLQHPSPLLSAFIG
jgi:acetyl esterase/lipase